MNFKLPADKSKFSVILTLVFAILAIVLMVANVYILVPILLFALAGVTFLFGYFVYDEELNDQ